MRAGHLSEYGADTCCAVKRSRQSPRTATPVDVPVLRTRTGVQFPPSPKRIFAILTERELFILELLLKDIRFDFTCVSVSYGYENYFSESDNKYYLKIY